LNAKELMLGRSRSQGYRYKVWFLALRTTTQEQPSSPGPLHWEGVFIPKTHLLAQSPVTLLDIGIRGEALQRSGETLAT